jgi:hypothetical protein
MMIMMMKKKTIAYIYTLLINSYIENSNKLYTAREILYDFVVFGIKSASCLPGPGVKGGGKSIPSSTKRMNFL